MIGKTGVEFCDRTSVRARLLAASLACTLRPLADRWALTPRRLRLLRLLLNARTTVVRARRGTLVQPVLFGGFGGEWLDASAVAVTRERAVLYLHGGGFVAGSPRSHRGLVSRLSEQAGGPVLSVGYRHPPEAPVENATSDGVAAYEWLLGQGWPPERVVIAGDGAGGNLVFTTALRVRERGTPPPAGLVALSGWFDLTFGADTVTGNMWLDPVMSMRLATQCAQTCERNSAAGLDLSDPRLSPVRARLDGLPPVLLQVGADERLRGDSELMAERLAKASVPCRLQLWKRQVHGFQTLAGLLPDAGRALAEAGAFIRDVTAARQPA